MENLKHFPGKRNDFECVADNTPDKLAGPVYLQLPLYLWLYLRICIWNESTHIRHTRTHTKTPLLHATGLANRCAQQAPKKHKRDRLQKVRQCSEKVSCLFCSKGCFKCHLECGWALNQSQRTKHKNLRDISPILVAKDTHKEIENLDTLAYSMEISVTIVAEICVNVGESHNVNAHKNKSKGIFRVETTSMKKMLQIPLIVSILQCIQRQKKNKMNQRSSFQLQRYFSSRVRSVYLKKLCIINTSHLLPVPLHTVQNSSK